MEATAHQIRQLKKLLQQGSCFTKGSRPNLPTNHDWTAIERNVFACLFEKTPKNHRNVTGGSGVMVL